MRFPHVLNWVFSLSWFIFTCIYYYLNCNFCIKFRGYVSNLGFYSCTILNSQWPCVSLNKIFPFMNIYIYSYHLIPKMTFCFSQLVVFEFTFHVGWQKVLSHHWSKQITINKISSHFVISNDRLEVPQWLYDNLLDPRCWHFCWISWVEYCLLAKPYSLNLCLNAKIFMAFNLKFWLLKIQISCSSFSILTAQKAMAFSLFPSTNIYTF